MKTRIILTALLIIGGVWFSSSIGRPVATIADNKVAIATVNGGDAEFVKYNRWGGAVPTTLIEGNGQSGLNLFLTPATAPRVAASTTTN